MQPQTIYDSAKPNELMDRFLDPETKLFIKSALLVKSVSVHVDKGKEDVVFALSVADQYWHDLKSCHHHEKSNQKIFVLHKLEDPSSSTRIVDFVCID